MMQFDLEYIDTWSLWRDLRLLVRTIIAVASRGSLLIQRRGAPMFPGPRARIAHRALLAVKPGLGGIWQVCGRSDTSYAERVEMDMCYEDRPSRADLG